MPKETLTWNKILNAVLRMPGVKVDRAAFLRRVLKDYCSQSKLSLIENVRPYAIVPDEVIDRVAKSVINRHTALATTASTIAGLPGGLAMAATIPGDITQYYFHVVVLSQKLAYLYGFPDFCDHGQDGAETPADEQLSDMAADLLTIFMGSMMGVKVADQGINEIARGVAQSAVGRLPRVALTKAVISPVAMKIAQMAGLKLSRDGLARSLGKFIPVAGGLFSGGITLFSFPRGAHRLQKRLKAQKAKFNDGGLDTLEFSNIKASFVKAERSQGHPEQKELALIQAMINMANMGGNVSAGKYQVIEHRVANSILDDDQKLELLGNVGTERDEENLSNYDVDYDVLACDPDYARAAIEAMLDVARADSRQLGSPESMYLSMTAKALGLSKDELEQLMAQ